MVVEPGPVTGVTGGEGGDRTVVDPGGAGPASRAGRRVLIRSDAAGATHELLNWLVARRLSCSVGFTLPDTITAELDKVPERDWQIACDADGEPRPGAAVLAVTRLLDLSRRPAGMRVIVRRERPHPGAQLRLTDRDGHRLTAFTTNTTPGGPGRQLADLGRTVVPIRQNHLAKTGTDRSRSPPHPGRRIRARSATSTTSSTPSVNTTASALAT